MRFLLVEIYNTYWLTPLNCVPYLQPTTTTLLGTDNKMPMALKICPEFFDRSYFYEMKVEVNFLRWGGSAPPYPRGWGCAPDPAFLQCHRELNG